MFNWLRSLLGMPAPRDRFTEGYVAELQRERNFLRARYESAQTTSENAPLWQLTDYLSPKAANSFQVRRVLKIRSRYEAANNSYFRGIIDSVANDLIGTGPRLQVKLDDPRASKQVEHAWTRWANAIDLAEKLRIMTKAKIQDGEGIGLLVNNDNLRHTLGATPGPARKGVQIPDQVDVDDAVQLDVVPIESDQMTTPDPGFIDYFWVDGIVLDRLGNPAEYHILRHHPGDYFVPQLNPLIYDRWLPRHLCHWFKADRAGQVRGIPEITPALDLFAQLRRYAKAVLGAAEVAADLAAVLETDAPAESEETAEPWEKIPIHRAMMVTLPSGAKLNAFDPKQPVTTFEQFVRVMLREICRCLKVPLNIAMGDSSGYNYSSGRLDHLGYHRQQRIDRSLCVSRVLSKIFCAWLEEAVMIPNLLPKGLSPAHVPHRWFWDSAESIDPLKDAMANKTKLETGETNLEEIWAEKGGDHNDAIRQRASELQLMESLGMPIPLPTGVTQKIDDKSTDTDDNTPE